jgi:DinB superfamily
MVTVHSPLNLGLTAEAAERLASDGLFADDADGLNAAYARITEMWLEAEARARAVDSTLLDERVDGEWSFLETVRHLIFATDSWVNGILLGNSPDFHALGMPPAHATEPPPGLMLDAKPTLDEVLAARADRRATTQAAFTAETDETLTGRCAGWDGQFVRAAALQVIVYEEEAHLRYATRDLDRLTS